MVASELGLTREEILDARELVSEYRFELGGIPVTITIRLYKRITKGDVEFKQSHFLKTPLQAEPSIPDRFWYSGTSVALEEAINGFAVPYDKAVREGHIPDVSWLSPNDGF